MTTVTLAGFNVDSPTIAPSGIGAQTSHGAMTPGNYKYKITFTTQFGETLTSPESSSITSFNTIILSNIQVSSNAEVSFKKIYRTDVNTSTYKYLATIANSATTYTDISSDLALDGAEPTANWAASEQICNGWTRFSKPIVYSIEDIAAAGSTRADATIISAENSFVSAPMDLNGVILPVIKDTLIGQKFTINNTSAINRIRIYPALITESIGDGLPGDPYILDPLLFVSIISSTSAAWTPSGMINNELPPALVSIGNLPTSGNEMLYTIATNTYATSAITPAGRSFLSNASSAQQRAAIGAVIGTDVQAYSSYLSSLATIAGGSANNMIYTTGPGFANSPISTFTRSTLLPSASASTFRANVGLAYLPADTNGGYNLSSDIVVGMAAGQTLTNKMINADSGNDLVLGDRTTFNGLAFDAVAVPTEGDMLTVIGGKLALAPPVGGDVDGPLSSTDNAIAIYNGVSGHTIKNSNVTISGTTVSGIGTINATMGNITTINATSVGGTLTTASQPGINEVGALTILDVTGDATIDGITTLNGGATIPTGSALVITDAPTDPTQATNKAYVDLVSSTGAAPLIAATGATTTVLPNTPTYNSAAGTLTAIGGINTLTVDGIVYTANSGQRLLVKNQADPRQNGVFNRTTDSSGNWQLTRTTDFDAPAEAIQNTSILVLGGTVNINTSWALQSTVTQFNPQLTTPGSSDVKWIQISASQNIIAGTGMTQAGNSFNVNGTINRIAVGTTSVDIASTYVGQTSITTLGTITTGIWNGTTLTPTYGGIGISNPTTNKVLISAGSSPFTLKDNPTSAFVGISDAQTLTNKIIDTGRIVTGTSVFANTSLTSNTLSLNTSGLSAARTITVPDSTDTFTLNATSQTLTNKILSSATNDIIARALWNNSGANSVSTYLAPNPTSGQVLTATSANTATWQTPSSSTGFAPSRVIFVYQGAPNVSPNYSTVAAGVAAANALNPVATNQVMIIIFPGVYSEVNPITIIPYITITTLTTSQGAIFIRPAAPAVTAPMFITSGNVRMMGFILSGRDASGGYATIGVQSSGSTSQIDLLTFVAIRNCSVSCVKLTGNGTKNSHLMITKSVSVQNTIAGTTVPIGFDISAGASLGSVDTIASGVFNGGIMGEITDVFKVYNDTTTANVNVLHVSYCTNAIRVGGGTISNSQTEYPTMRAGAAFITNISGTSVIMEEKSVAVLGDFKNEDSSGTFPNQKQLYVTNPALPAEPNLLQLVSAVARSDKIVIAGAFNNMVRIIGWGLSDVPGEAQTRFQGEVTIGSPLIPAEFSSGEGDSTTVGFVAFLNSGATFTNVTSFLNTAMQSPIAVNTATVASINLASAPATIDGVVPTLGTTRVLVKDGSSINPGATSVDNGIYIWNGAGVAMTRATDFAAGSRRSHDTWFIVDLGTVNYGSAWKISETGLGTDTVIVGTTSWGVRAQSSRIFPSPAATNDAIYFGSATPIKFPGLLLGVIKPILLTAPPTTSALVWEYWNGSAWDSLTFQSNLADAPYTNSGNTSFAYNLVVVNPNIIRVNQRFGNFLTSWATTTVNGVLAYWIRVRCLNASLITRVPTITRVQFHVNYTRIGSDGYMEYFGNARPRVDNKMTWNDTGISGENTTAIRLIGCTSPVTVSSSGILNTFNSSAMKSVMTIWRPPVSIDASTALQLKIYGSVGNGGGGGNIVLNVNYVFVKDGDAIPNPTGGATAIGGTTIITIIAAPVVNRGAFSTTIPVNIFGLNPTTDTLWLKFSRNGASASDTFSADMYLHTMVFSTVRWSNGEYYS